MTYRDHEGSRGKTSPTGPHPITAGDLTANMIGDATLRITHNGATIEGPLNELHIESSTETLYGGVRELVVHVEVDIKIGSIALMGLARSHPVTVIARARKENNHGA